MQNAKLKMSEIVLSLKQTLAVLLVYLVITSATKLLGGPFFAS